MARTHHEGVDRPEESKRCTRCDDYFPLTQKSFYTRKRNGKVYFSSYCVACQKDYGKQWYRERANPAPMFPESYYERLDEARKAGLNKPISIADLAEDI